MGWQGPPLNNRSALLGFLGAAPTRAFLCGFQVFSGGSVCLRTGCSSAWSETLCNPSVFNLVFFFNSIFFPSKWLHVYIRKGSELPRQGP